MVACWGRPISCRGQTRNRDKLRMHNIGVETGMIRWWTGDSNCAEKETVLAFHWLVPFVLLKPSFDMEAMFVQDGLEAKAIVCEVGLCCLALVHKMPEIVSIACHTWRQCNLDSITSWRTCRTLHKESILGFWMNKPQAAGIHHGQHKSRLGSTCHVHPLTFTRCSPSCSVFWSLLF